MCFECLCSMDHQDGIRLIRPHNLTLVIMRIYRRRLYRRAPAFTTYRPRPLFRRRRAFASRRYRFRRRYQMPHPYLLGSLQPSSRKKRWAVKWYRFYHMEIPIHRQLNRYGPQNWEQWVRVIRYAWTLQRRYYRENGWYQPTVMTDPPPGDFQQAYFDRVESDEELQAFRRDHLYD